MLITFVIHHSVFAFTVNTGLTLDAELTLVNRFKTTVISLLWLNRKSWAESCSLDWCWCCFTQARVCLEYFPVGFWRETTSNSCAFTVKLGTQFFVPTTTYLNLFKILLTMRCIVKQNNTAEVYADLFEWLWYFQWVNILLKTVQSSPKWHNFWYIFLTQSENKIISC